MKSKLIVLKVLATVVASIGLSVGATHAQSGQEIYYEGRSWNQFHDRFGYFKGNASQLCAASIAAWDKVTKVTLYGPAYTKHVQGINKGNYEVRTSPPYTFPYVLCGADLKTTYTYPGNSHLDSTLVIEDFDSTVEIISERDVTQECETARENLLQQGTPLPEYCAEFPSNPSICNGKRKPGDWGNLACTNNSDFTFCFWPEGLLEGDREHHVTDAVARQAMGICVGEHEQSHIGDVGQTCWQGAHAIYGNRNTAIAEIDAYNIEMACYNREKPNCRDNNTCIAQIDHRMDRIQAEINRLNSILPTLSN